jgi:hypothetical protein
MVRNHVQQAVMKNYCSSYNAPSPRIETTILKKSTLTMCSIAFMDIFPSGFLENLRVDG